MNPPRLPNWLMLRRTVAEGGGSPVSLEAIVTYFSSISAAFCLE
jgi:hypothetical protein